MASYKWTEAEDAILRMYYPLEGGSVSARLPGRGTQSCYARALALGITQKKNEATQSWTPEETAIIKEYYLSEKNNIAKRLPGRSLAACQQYARALGLTESRHRWTIDEDTILINYYPIEGADICKRLPNRSAMACQRRFTLLVKAIEAQDDTPLAQPASDSFSPASNWTKVEDDILCDFYPSEGPSVYKRLPHRDAASCQARFVFLTGLDPFDDDDVSLQQKDICSSSGQSHRAWTDEEDDILRRYYPIEFGAVSARLPNRNEPTCYARARTLGLSAKKAAFRPWSAEERAIMEKYYPIEGSAVSARLNNRSPNACRVYAASIGLTQADKRRWLTKEDEILKQYYPEEGTRVCNRLPGRNKTACRKRAALLGIPHHWSAEEDAILRQHYESDGPQKTSELLPWRSAEACTVRMKYLKVHHKLDP